MHPKTLLTLPLLIALASPVLAEDDKDLLAQCDVDRNGTINGPANDLPPAAWTMIEKERVCMREYELDQLAKAMPDIRKRCDLNGNGRIDHPEPLITPLMVSGKETTGKKAYRSLPEDVRKQVDAEQQCVRHASIAKLDASIAKLDDDYKKMVQILAMLSPVEAKKVIADEILRLEKQLSQEKNPTTVKSIETKLAALRTEQQKLK